jgi:Big-like domain-containing protein
VEATHSTSFKVDQTPPAITPTRSPAPNANGWNNTSVTVSFICSDALSGLAGACPTSVTLSTEGGNQVVSRSISDNAGNTSTASVTVNIDLTKPVTTASITGTLGNNGWYKAPGPAVLTLTATDNLSGVAVTNYTVNGGATQTYTGPVTFLDGKYTVLYWSTDRAGNVEAQKSISFKVDETPPTEIETLSPTPDSYGWNNTSVTVSFTCSDAMSGLATACPASVSLTLEGAKQVVSGTVSDNAGNSTTVSKAVNIDETRPSTTSSISGTMGNSGWYKAGSPVVLTLTATDNLSGVAFTTWNINSGSNQTYSGSITFTDGTYTVNFWSTDKANNVEPMRSVSFKVDQTPPTVTITGVTNGATYILGNVPTPGMTYSDSGSGIASHNHTLTSPTTASGVGTYTYTATATDNAGNTTTVTATYSVVYKWGGFLAPLSTTTSFPKGTTIAVKFRVMNSSGTVVSNASASLQVDGATVGSFTYDSTNTWYIYNLATGNMTTGNHTLTVVLDDNTAQSITITLT